MNIYKIYTKAFLSINFLSHIKKTLLQCLNIMLYFLVLIITGIIRMINEFMIEENLMTDSESLYLNVFNKIINYKIMFTHTIFLKKV